MRRLSKKTKTMTKMQTKEKQGINNEYPPLSKSIESKVWVWMFDVENVKLLSQTNNGILSLIIGESDFNTPSI